MTSNIRDTENTSTAKALRALAFILKTNGTITQFQFEQLKAIAGDNS